MKTLHILLSLILLFAVSACSGGSEAPSITSDGAISNPNMPKPSVDEKLAEEAGQERVIYHVGPVDLPAGTEIKTMLDKPLTMGFQMNKEVWVTAFKPKIVDINGAELPSTLLHEAMMFNMHEENPLCTGGPNPFVVASSTLTEISLPQGYGYPILATDPLKARVILKNETDKDYIDVFFELTLVTRPINELSKLQDVKPMLLETDPCGHMPVNAPPHTMTEKRVAYQIPENGNIIVAEGVLQDYGVNVELTSGKEVKPFWRAEAIQDKAHRIIALTDNPYTDPEGVNFKAGDKITLGVAYDNTSDKWLYGSTAAAMVYLAIKE